jgi:hypothetical protein
MTCLGEMQSPLEAPVQELCNARLVEEFAHMDQNGPPNSSQRFSFAGRFRAGFCGYRPAARALPKRSPRRAYGRRLLPGRGGSTRWIPDCVARNGACGCRTTPRAGHASCHGCKAMKTRYFPCLLPICMLLSACGPTASRSQADAVTFDTAERLADFDFAASADGGPGKWSIIDNDASRV